MHPVCSGPLRPELSAIAWMLGANVGYEMLGYDAGSAGLANQDPLFDQEMEQPGLRRIFCGHPSRVMSKLQYKASDYRDNAGGTSETRTGTREAGRV